MSIIKTTLKSVIPKEHWYFLSWYREHFGLLATLSAYRYLLFHHGLSRAPNKFNGRPIFLRPGTADLQVYHQIFKGDHYNIDLGNPLNIVDAGAHVGISAVFFASLYPQATIFAVEPEISNYNLLRTNTMEYPNVKPLHAGLWCKKGYLSISDKRVDTWAYRVSEDTHGERIPGIGVRDLMKDYDLPKIDVLKMDIEGSEIEVLEGCDDWIDRVGVIIIELHDWFRPGCTEALKKALRGHTFDAYRSGENFVIKNLERVTIR